MLINFDLSLKVLDFNHVEHVIRIKLCDVCILYMYIKHIYTTGILCAMEENLKKIKMYYFFFSYIKAKSSNNFPIDWHHLTSKLIRKF